MSLVRSRVVPILLALLSLSARSIKSSEIINTLQELNPGPSDQEATQFLLPKLAEKYLKYVQSGADSTEDRGWDEYVYDPKLFLLTETEEAPPNEDNYVNDYRNKREAMISENGLGNSFRGNWKSNGPSLSIVNPLDVLRQRLLLEIARRRQEKSQSQITENRKILTSLGKRSGLEVVRPSRGFEPRERNILETGILEPSTTFSKWASSLAQFPRPEHRFRGHRNYNWHVN